MSKQILKTVLVTLILFGCLSKGKAGGPWLWGTGEGFFQIQFIPLANVYDQLLNGTGFDARDINREVYALDYGLYGEFGLTDRLNILASLPFKYARVGGLTDTPDAFPNLLEEGTINGLSNVRLGIKYGILDKNLKVALSAITSLNTVSTDLERGLATGFQGTSVGLTAHVGGAISRKWYAFGELGFQYMFNEFDDAIEGAFEIGRKIDSKFTVLMRFDIRESLENGDFYDERLVQTGLFPANQSWIAGSLKVNYESPKNYGLNFGMALVPIKFQNVGYTGSFAFGAYVKI